jgi:hypothetical protein
VHYGEILKRAFNIIWEHKFLILLGVIVALGSSNGGAGGGSYSFGGGPSGDADFGTPRWEVPDVPRDFAVPAVLITIFVLVIISLALIVGIALWIVSTIARGGLIAGVSTIDGGGASAFGQAWSAGWQKGWRLLGIGILPGIPAFLLVITGLGGAGVIAAVYGLFGEEALLPSGAGLGLLFAALACILIPISLVLGLLQTFANRACMLEDRGVIASYRRGLTVLVENIGPAIVLFLIQVAINIVLGVALFLPGVVMVVCCLLWPLLLAIQGAIASYFSTMWTLAWREWTGLGHAGQLTEVEADSAA